MKIKNIILFFGIIFVSGCSLSPIKTTPVSMYTLTDSTINTAGYQKTQTRQTIVVTQPSAAPDYATTRMIYEKIPYQLNAFADNRWISPPSSLLLTLIVKRLQATHYFHAVATAPFAGTVNYQLNTKLLLLKQEFLRPQSQVRLAMEATLINVSTGNIIAIRVFETVVPAAENNPYSGVLASNRAVHIVLNRIARFVISNTKNNVK